jgi:hypothetical protein
VPSIVAGTICNVQRIGSDQRKVKIGFIALPARRTRATYIANVTKGLVRYFSMLKLLITVIDRSGAHNDPV